MKRDQKSSLISKVQGSLEGTNGVFVVENHGLTVREFQELRNTLRPVVNQFKVMKNRLLKRALDGSVFAVVSEFLKRPTAVAMATDSFAVAKALANFAENHPNLTILGGFMESKLLSQSDIIELSKLPSLLEIRGTIARIIVEPASRLARVSAEFGKN